MFRILLKRTIFVELLLPIIHATIRARDALLRMENALQAVRKIHRWGLGDECDNPENKIPALVTTGVTHILVIACRCTGGRDPLLARCGRGNLVRGLLHLSNACFYALVVQGGGGGPGHLV